MLETLSKGFRAARERLTGVAELSEENIESALRDVRMALLEADVALPVVRQFLQRVKEKAVGQSVKLRAKAESLGWLTAEQSISESALLQFIFRPGFSTAEKVTGVSGRGVGMDVVRHNIEALRGRVELGSELGKGTTISIRLPLTLAIIDVMLVRAGGCLFGLPVLSLRESVSIGQDAVTPLPDGARIIRIRDRILPVIGLDTIFGLGSGHEPSAGLVAIVEHGTRVCGLRVDQLLGQRQIVIKPLDPYISGIRGVSGCAVLGSGEICLILDIRQVLEVQVEHDRREAA
jgi:two-component system chemotaxis sensor kinase CheA